MDNKLASYPMISLTLLHAARAHQAALAAGTATETDEIEFARLVAQSAGALVVVERSLMAVYVEADAGNAGFERASAVVVAFPTRSAAVELEVR